MIMRKHLFTFLLSACSMSMFAIDDYVIATFEDGAQGEHGVSIYNEFASGFDPSHYEVLPDVRENPDPSGINTSSKCVTQTLKGTATRWGAITYLDFVTDLTPELMKERPYMKIMVWRSFDDNNFRVSFAKRTYDKRGGSWNDGTNPYVGKPAKGEWVDIVIDLSKEVTSDGTTNTDPKGTKFKWQDQNIWSMGLQNIENFSSQLGFPVTVYYDNIVLSADPMPRGMRVFEENNVSFDFEDVETEAATWLEEDSISAQNALNSFEIIDNPVKDAVNNTEKVMKFNKSAECRWWEGGPKFVFDGLVPLSESEYSYMHTFVYLPSDGTTTEIPITIQLNATDWTGNTHQIEYDNYLFDTDMWVDMVMEINTLTHLKQFAVRFDVQKDETSQYIQTPAAYYYLDGVVLNNDPEPRESKSGLAKPNRVDDLLNVRTEGQDLVLTANSEVSVQLFSLTGRLMATRQLHSGETGTFAQTPGIYCVKAIDADGNQMVQKVVVK